MTSPFSPPVTSFSRKSYFVISSSLVTLFWPPTLPHVDQCGLSVYPPPQPCGLLKDPLCTLPLPVHMVYECPLEEVLFSTMCVVLIHTTLQLWIGSHQNEEFFVFAFFATRRKIDFFIFFLPAKNWKKLLRLKEFWWLHTWTLKHSQVTRIKREIKATHLSNKIGCRHCPSN